MGNFCTVTVHEKGAKEGVLQYDAHARSCAKFTLRA